MRAPLLLLALALGGCADGLDPSSERGPAFAVVGTLDARRDAQRLRVQDLADALVDLDPVLAATVRSTEQTTGAETTWRDSLGTFPDGTQTHVALADLDIAPGQTHVVAVDGDDGRAARVTVRLPAPTAVPAVAPVNGALRITLDDLGGRTTRATVALRVRRTDGGAERSLESLVNVQAAGAGDGTFLMFLFQDATRAKSLLYGASPGEPVFLGATLTTTVFSTEDAPVDGGVGGVGWVLPVAVDIPVPSAVLAAAGFVDGR